MDRKHNKKAQGEHPASPAASVDRISGLPDAILVDILTLLPTKTAVSTSVLSNRWRSLWTPHLDFLHFPQNSPQFYSIVDHLLNRLTSPFLRTFSLDAPFYLDRHFESWFRHLPTRNIQYIKIDIHSQTTTDSGTASPFVMPLCIFRTRSLVSLNFPTFNLHYDLPDDTRLDIQLPNLRKLGLSISASECGFVSKLVSSCPLLEDLSLSATDNWRRKADKNDDAKHVFIDISSVNLKRLQLNFFAASENVDVLIDAPKLDCFVLLGSKLNCSFANKPLALGEACIITAIISQSLVLALLPVRVLHIQASTFSLFNLTDNQGNSLAFRNLMELKLQLGPAAYALNSFPFESPPLSMLLRVKKIQIIMVNVKTGKNLTKLAEYLLRTAPALERLTFSVLPHPSQSQDKQQYMIDEMAVCTDLMSCSLMSSRCVMEFQGQFVKLP